jgi:hypothetical protein
MKTFKHTTAWIHNVISYEGYPVLEPVPCDTAYHCIIRYHTEDSCEGHKIHFDRETFCPYEVDIVRPPTEDKKWFMYPSCWMVKCLHLTP